MKKDFIIILLSCCTLICIDMLFGRNKARTGDNKQTADTTIITDTICRCDTIYKVCERIVSVPRLVVSKRIDTCYIVTQEKDTMYREQQEYSDSCYTAYVSGINATLDSIRIYNNIVEVYQYRDIIKDRTINKYNPIRFELQGGVGVTPKGILPYIGAGIGVSF